MDRQEKLLQVYEALRSKGVVHTRKDFAEVLGYNRSNVSRALNGDDRYLTNSLFERIDEMFPNLLSECEAQESVISEEEKGIVESIPVTKSVPSFDIDDFKKHVKKSLGDNDTLQIMLDMSRQIGILEAKVEYLEKRLAAYESGSVTDVAREMKDAQ